MGVAGDLPALFRRDEHGTFVVRGDAIEVSDMLGGYPSEVVTTALERLLVEPEFQAALSFLVTIGEEAGLVVSFIYEGTRTNLL